MSTLRIDASGDIRALKRDFAAFWDQAPFATALALTKTAQAVAAAETSSFQSDLDAPTPFTLKAMAVQPATKSNHTAVAFVKDRQAAYLAPELEGHGLQVLHGGSRAVLMPIEVARDRYGNIPKDKLQQLKGRPDIFIGPVKTKGGVISGVWQRPASPAALKGAKRVRGARLNRTGHLKLLIRFQDPKDVRTDLGYEARAAQIVKTRIGPELRAAFNRAIATRLRR